MAFVKEYNERTSSQTGTVVPVQITIFEDRSFSFITKSPPAAVLLKQAAGITKGSPEPHKEKVGKVGRDQVLEIAKQKFEDLNARDLDHAARIIEGTARSMGIEVEV